MPDDPNPVPVGSTGTVRSCQTLNNWGDNLQRYAIGVAWDSGRSLSMIWPSDAFEIIEG